MPDLDTIATALLHGNHHATLYGALGCMQVLRAGLIRRERRYDDAREQAVHGLVMLLLALL